MINMFNWVENLIGYFTFNMGGGGKSSSAPQNSTSYSTNLPEYAKPFYEELLKQTGKQVYATDEAGNVTGVKEYTPYTGERVAAFTPEQKAYQSEVAGLRTPGGFGTAATGIGRGEAMGYGAAGAGLGQALAYDPSRTPIFSRAAASYYADPYASAVTDIAVREAERKGALDKTAAMTGAIGRGTFGGARQGLMQAEQQRNLNQNLADIRAKGAEAAYQNAQQQFNADVTRQQQGQQFAAGLGKDIGLAGLTTGLEAAGKTGALAAQEQTSNLERLKAQAATAGEAQAYQQEIDNIKYQQFMEQQDYQKQQLDYLSNILRGNAAALGTSKVTYAPAPSLAGQLGSLGLSGLGLYQLMNKG